MTDRAQVLGLKDVIGLEEKERISPSGLLLMASDDWRTPLKFCRRLISKETCNSIRIKAKNLVGENKKSISLTTALSLAGIRNN